MRKLLLLLLILPFFNLGLYSQAVNLVDEDFEAATIPNGWFTYNLGDSDCDSENWTFGSGEVPGSVDDFPTNAAIFDDDSYGSDGDHNKSCLFMFQPNTYYVGYDLSGYAGPITLYYDYAFNDYAGEVLQVVIWDNTATDWIVLKTYDTDTDPTSDTVDIRAALNANSGINPTNVYIGFIYDDVDGAWGFGAGVDNVRLEVYPAPANDACDNAQDISGAVYTTGFSADIDASGATNNDGFIDICSDSMNDGVWYAFYAYYEGSVTVDVQPDASFDPQIGVYEGNDCSSLTCVGTVDDGWSGGDPETITFDVDAGSTYYINVGYWGDSFDAFEGPFHMDVNFNCAGSSVPNDLIADAIEITDPTFSDTVNMPCANAETGNFIGCAYGGFKSAFYKFHTTASSTVVAQILNPTGVSAAVFYEAPSLNATEDQLERVDQTSNPCAPGDTYSIVTEADKDYYVVLTNGSETTITINGVYNNTGISDQVIAGLKMYPNPVEDMLNIQSPDSMKEISVFNIAGQKVAAFNPDTTDFQINTSGWSTGTYVVKILTQNQTGIYHIVKE